MDMPSSDTSWAEANRAYLVAEFARIRELISSDFGVGAEREAANIRRAMQQPPAIDWLVELFQLSGFERELLLLCAGVEMDSALAARCAAVSGHPQRSDVTFSLAMAALANPHWSALAPSSPLRRFRLIELEPGHGVTAAPLRIDERILHYLAGVNQLDQRLESVLYRKSQSGWLAEEHWRLVTETIQPAFDHLPASTVLHFCGDDVAGQEGIAALVANRAGGSSAVRVAPGGHPVRGRRAGAVLAAVDARGSASPRVLCCCSGRATRRARPLAYWPRDCRER